MNLTPKQKEVVERLEEGWYMYRAKIDRWDNRPIIPPYVLCHPTSCEHSIVHNNTINSLIKKGIIDSNYKLIT